MPIECDDCMAFYRACCYLDKAVPVFGYADNPARIRAATDEILRLRAELAKTQSPKGGE